MSKWSVSKASAKRVAQNFMNLESGHSLDDWIRALRADGYDGAYITRRIPEILRTLHDEAPGLAFGIGMQLLDRVLSECTDHRKVMRSLTHVMWHANQTAPTFVEVEDE